MTELFDRIGRAGCCVDLARRFYARVGQDGELKPLFPGKRLRCATEEMAAFLVQFMGGVEEDSQKRWWLSLAESHARFKISTTQRDAWLAAMAATLTEGEDPATEADLYDFFAVAAAYLTGDLGQRPHAPDLTDLWARQLALDAAVAALAVEAPRDGLRQFADRPTVYVGLLARLLGTGYAADADFVLAELRAKPALAKSRFAGANLLHFAAASGQVAIVRQLLEMGVGADISDRGGHSPLYALANQWAGETGPQIVALLVGAGANVNRQSGVTGATALHMAARRGNVAIAKALLDHGALPNLPDKKGVTPLARALNLKRDETAELIRSAGGRR